MYRPIMRGGVMPNAIENKNSMFSYNRLQQLEVPKTLYIASADKKIRGAVRLTACKTDFYFNNCSQLTFTTWKKYSGELEKYYDEIQVSRYVLFHVMSTGLEFAMLRK